MINLITGKIGGGKTYWCVNYLVEKYYQYKASIFQYVPNKTNLRIITNIDSLDLPHENLEKLVDEKGLEGVFCPEFIGADSCIFIIDEAHSLGQFPQPSLRTAQLKSLCCKLPIIFLSGTPSPESYSQLFHQFWVSSFSPFGERSFYLWAKNYVTVAEKYIFNRKINDYSNANQQRIENMTQHLFIPYTQEEAGFTELVQETVHHVRMSDKVYDVTIKVCCIIICVIFLYRLNCLLFCYKNYVFYP